MSGLIAHIGVLVCAIIALAASPVCAGEKVVDPDLGFTLTLPDGFKVHRDRTGAPERIAHAFILGDPNDEAVDILLLVQTMRGTIGPERIRRENLAPGFQGRVFTEVWKGHVVDVVTVPETIGDHQTVTFNVQVPLKKAAIQLMLFGPAERDAELQPLLKEVLDGLDGESNWDVSATPLAFNPPSAVVLGFAVVLFVGVLLGLWLFGPRLPRGTALIVAAGLYVSSFGLDEPKTRDVVFLQGVLRLTGICAGMVGLIDWYRRRPSASPPARD
jgi:hypothetical protein